jgi:putative inorganic carbon (HCO3(-)) transporter
MAILRTATPIQDNLSEFCDQGIIFSLCLLIFVLPASIAILDVCAALAVLFYMLKKISRIIAQWPSAAPRLGLTEKIKFVWNGFAPGKSSLARPLQFLALAVFISVLFSQYPDLSVKAFFGKFVKCMFLYICFIEAFNNKKRLWTFVAVLFLSAFIASLSGAFQHYTGKDFIKGRPLGTENYVTVSRVSSSFAGANSFGPYILLVLSLAVHLLFSTFNRPASWLARTALVLLAGLLLACLCWTYSRSSWVGFLVILFVTVLLDRRKMILVGSLLLVFIFVFLPSLQSIRHMNLTNDSSHRAVSDAGKGSPHSGPVLGSLLQNGGSGRLSYWKRAVSVIESSPIFGTGPNTYARVLMRDTDPKEIWYAHNGYLQMAAETGLAGLACFLWVLFVLFSQAIRSCKKIKDIYPLALLQGSIAGLSGFLVQSFFDNTFYTVQLSMLMWVFFGFMSALTFLPSEL